MLLVLFTPLSNSLKSFRKFYNQNRILIRELFMHLSPEVFFTVSF